MRLETQIFLTTLNDVINHIPLQILLWLVIIDVITGVSKAVKTKEVDSKISTNGMIRHVIVLFIVVLVGVYARILGFEWVAASIGYYYVGSYGISIVENASAIGLPLPKFVTQYFQRMRDENDEEPKKHDRTHH